MQYVICYDIPDDHRRTRIAEILKDYGTRIQYSVFLADLDDALTERLKDSLTRQIRAEEDKLHIFVLCAACSSKTEYLGLAELPCDQPYYIL